MSYLNRQAFTVVCLFGLLLIASGSTVAQVPGLNNPRPELVGLLTKQLKIKPEQAIGGAGALFGLAQSRLKPEQFGQISKAVPGMDGLLGAAPKQKSGTMDSVMGMATMLPGKAGGLASTAAAFKSLGLSPSMAAKFVPIMGSFVKMKGGAQVADLLTGALK